MMKLEDTIGLMCSEDERDRMKAEYIQLSIRIKELTRKIDEDVTAVGYAVADAWIQIGYMDSYRDILRDRMRDCGIEVNMIDDMLLKGS